MSSRAEYMRWYRAQHPKYKQAEVGRVRRKRNSVPKPTPAEAAEKLARRQQESIVRTQELTEERRQRRLGFNSKLPTPKPSITGSPLSRHPDIDQMYLDWRAEVESGTPRRVPTNNFGPPKTTMGTIANRKYHPKENNNF